MYLSMYLSIYMTYIYIYSYIRVYMHTYILYKADANAAAKELADAAHVCRRMLTYTDVCRSRRPKPQQQT
jgi:hypothetical protein